MDLELAGHSVIVTGASRGLGYAIAEGFAREGARLTVCARSAGPLEEARVRLLAAGAADAQAVAGDVVIAADCERLVAAAMERYGGVDVLVNNAGGTVRADTPEASLLATFEANVGSVSRLSLLVKPHLLRAVNGGAIINISSIYGRESGGSVDYNAAKAAQIALSKAYALQWAREGIRVNNLAPGSIAFEGGGWGRRLAEDPEGMADFVARNIPGGRFGRPEEIANVVVFLASPRASWVIGVTINVDGGQSRSNI